MKKSSILIALASVIALVVPASALELGDIKVGGQIEVRGMAKDIDMPDGYNDWVIQRALLSLSADVADNTSAYLLLGESGRVWGNNVEDQDVKFKEAYLKFVDIRDVVDLTVGRQAIGIAHDPILYFGVKDNHYLSVTALDAFRADLNIRDMGDLTLFGGKLKEESIEPWGEDRQEEIEVYGIVASTEWLVPLGTLRGYFYLQDGEDVPPDRLGQDFGVIGLSVRAEVPAVDGLGYKLEVAKNTGDYEGLAYILAGSYDLPLAWADLGFSLEYVAADGGKEEYNEDMFKPIAPDAAYGGVWNIPDFAGRTISNQKIICLGVKLIPAAEGWDRLTVGLKYIVLKADEEDWFVLGGEGFALDDDELGNEVDLSFTYTLSESISLAGSFGYFMPGDAFPVVDYGDDDAYKVMVKAIVKF